MSDIKIKNTAGIKINDVMKIAFWKGKQKNKLFPSKTKEINSSIDLSKVKYPCWALYEHGVYLLCRRDEIVYIYSHNCRCLGHFEIEKNNFHCWIKKYDNPLAIKEIEWLSKEDF